MQPVINQIHKLLLKNQKTVSVAESCSGGLLSNLLTYISGSSQYFVLGVVAYHNKAKESILKVAPAIFSKYGAVSKEVASLMAKNIRILAKTDFGIAITGIAGPTGATIQKPVGTVFIAIDSKNKKICKKFQFRGNRSSIRRKAAIKALESLKIFLRVAAKTSPLFARSSSLLRRGEHEKGVLTDRTRKKINP